MTTRTYINAAPPTTLASPIGSGDTSISLASLAGFPGTFPYTATLAISTSTVELVLVTGATGSTATVQRGYDGTVAQAHSAGVDFRETVAAIDYRESNTHINSASAVHGISGAVVGTTDAQVLTNKTLSAPTVQGGALAKSLSTGDASTAAVRAQATTVGGLTLAALNSSGTSSFTVDDSGNVNTPGTLAAGGINAAAGTLSATTVNATTLAVSGALGANTVTATAVTSSGPVTATAVTASGSVTAADVVSAGASVPRGLLPGGSASSVGGFNCGSAGTSLVSVSVPVVAGRTYRVTGYCNGAEINTVGTLLQAQVRAAGALLVYACYASSAAINQVVLGTGVGFFTAVSSGTVVFDVFGLAASGLYQVTGGNAQIAVEDVG